MPYLNLHRTASGDLVTPVDALDNNWDQIDSKFYAIDSKSNPVGTGVTTPNTGMEFVSSKTATPEIAVWNGVTYAPISVAETWGSWVNFTLGVNFNPVGARIPQIRVSNLGKIQCRGAVQYLTGSTAWPAGYQLINSGQLADSAYAPGLAFSRNLTATPTGSTTWSYGQGFVTRAGGFLNLYLMYVGTALGSGNIMSIDGLGWYL